MIFAPGEVGSALLAVSNSELHRVMALSFAAQEERKNRRISWLSFLGVSMLFSVAFTLMPTPGQEFAETTIERLILTSVELPPVEEIEIETEPLAEEEDPLETIEEIAESLEPEAPAEEVLEEDVEALIADAFETFSFSDVSVEDPVAQQENREIVSLSDEDMDLFSEAASERPVFNSDMDLTQNLLNDSGNPTRASRSLSSNLIGQSLASTDDTDRSRRYVGDLEGLAWPDASGRQTIRATGGAGAPSLESSGSGSRQDNLFLGDGDISVPSDSLLMWIMENQSELDPGIRSLFYFAPPAISARDETTIGAAPSELQLMYTPSNREIRIAMIREGAIYYFVDPGFQQRAQYFQKGVVGRDDMERVDFVQSEDFSPTGPEARDFFRLFLAWWQQEKQNM